MNKVVVTGGAGFVGHHLVNQLLGHGYHVVVLDDMSRGRNVSDSAEYIIGDATVLNTCIEAFDGADIVFNLAAAVAGVEYNMGHGYQMLLDNIPLQVIPVAAAETVGVPVFLQVSSACVYHSSVNHPAHENMIGENPHETNFGYGWAKRLGERMALASKIARVSVVRPSNIYGPKDYFDEKAHVIPSLIKQNQWGSVRMIGEGSGTREFLYVEDAASGMIHVATNGLDREAYNLGTNGETRISMLDLSKIISKTMGTSPSIFTVPEYANPERDRWADCSKINRLGWHHTVSLDDGIRKTVGWYLGQ